MKKTALLANIAESNTVEQIDDLLAGVDAQIADTEEYLRTKADIMLSLYISRESEGYRALGLKNRERPIYREKGTEIDLLGQSGILVPEYQETGRFLCMGTDAASLPGIVRFGNQFCAERDELVQAVHALFSRIRAYEGQRIDYPGGYHGHEAGRNAHVSVTGLGVLKRFDIPELQRLPDIYLTTDAQSELISLPPTTTGTIIRIPRFTNQN
ncbi:hypothetical protein KY363_03340 [Candidatus Woesearchaeota archaeon]|nr:hypothetical protein [Candidatus Woesearchaeota archaeon]